MCIPMEQRCNEIADCEDESDEVFCRLINLDFLDTKYKAILPPRPTNQSRALPITVGFDILEILEVDERTMTFNLKFDLFLSWREHRLIFYDLKPKMLSNKILDFVADKLWIPALIFSNHRDRIQVEFKRFSTLTVKKLSNGSIADLQELHESILYPGSSNPFKLKNSYGLKLSCDFDLSYYPFDTQECWIEVSVSIVRSGIINTAATTYYHSISVESSGCDDGQCWVDPGTSKVPGKRESEAVQDWKN